ncbi:MAG: site-specific DNA-methyltransferase [Desulfobacteraceae bacterium]|nr:site-specific DNA-methyltransferase [Desulfobacteraceae bacterium]
MIINADSHSFLPAIRDKSFDLICIDPPYGMGIDTWDKPVDVRFFTEQVARIGREFYAVFGQMPYLRQWDREAERCGLHYMEHISWVKRNGSPSQRLIKMHESILIYGLGKRRKFYQTTGKYSDVKFPGIMFDLYDVKSLSRLFSDLHCKAERGEWIQCKDDSPSAEQYKRFHSSRVRNHHNYENTNFTNVWSFLPENRKVRNGKYRHPTEKPELVIMRLLEMLTGEGGSVLDFFSGSGTVAVAAKRLKRKCLCIEKDAGFYEASVQRVKNDMYQLKLCIDKL